MISSPLLSPASWSLFGQDLCVGSRVDSSWVWGCRPSSYSLPHRRLRENSSLSIIGPFCSAAIQDRWWCKDRPRLSRPTISPDFRRNSGNLDKLRILRLWAGPHHHDCCPPPPTTKVYREIFGERSEDIASWGIWVVQDIYERTSIGSISGGRGYCKPRVWVPPHDHQT